MSAWSQTSRNGSWARSGLRSASASCVQAPAICSIAAQFEAVTSRVSIPPRSLRNLRSAFMADVLPLLLAPTSRVCLSDMSKRARRNLRKLKTSMRVSFIISVSPSQELLRWCMYIYLSCGFVAVLNRQGSCQSSHVRPFALRAHRGGGGNRIVGGGPLTGLEAQRRRPWCLVFGRSPSSRVTRPWMPKGSHAFAANDGFPPCGPALGDGAHRRAAPANGSSVTQYYHRGPVRAALRDERQLWRMPRSSILSGRAAAKGRERGDRRCL